MYADFSLELPVGNLNSKGMNKFLLRRQRKEPGHVSKGTASLHFCHQGLKHSNKNPNKNLKSQCKSIPCFKFIFLPFLKVYIHMLYGAENLYKRLQPILFWERAKD